MKFTTPTTRMSWWQQPMNLASCETVHPELPAATVHDIYDLAVNAAVSSYATLHTGLDMARLLPCAGLT